MGAYRWRTPQSRILSLFMVFLRFVTRDSRLSASLPDPCPRPLALIMQVQRHEGDAANQMDTQYHFSQPPYTDMGLGGFAEGG